MDQKTTDKFSKMDNLEKQIKNANLGNILSKRRNLFRKILRKCENLSKKYFFLRI